MVEKAVYLLDKGSPAQAGAKTATVPGIFPWLSFAWLLELLFFVGLL